MTIQILGIQNSMKHEMLQLKYNLTVFATIQNKLGNKGEKEKYISFCNVFCVLEL